MTRTTPAMAAMERELGYRLLMRLEHLLEAGLSLLWRAYDRLQNLRAGICGPGKGNG